MGLFGALIVPPERRAAPMPTTGPTRVQPDDEFLVLLSEIDPYQHQAVEQGKPFNINNYQPRYWLINGRGFPDSIADNVASWLPSQPYGALAHDPTRFDGARSTRSRTRRAWRATSTSGREDYPFHPHGNNGLVIGRDGQPARRAPPARTSRSRSSRSTSVPGQTWDVLFSWYDARTTTRATRCRSTCPTSPTSVIGMFYSGSPYLGDARPLPPGVTDASTSAVSTTSSPTTTRSTRSPRGART